MIENVLYGLIGLATIAVVEAYIERRTLIRKMQHARHNAPADSETGLLTVEAFQQRAAAEIKRAERYKGTILFSFWNVGRGDPEAFGVSVRNELRFPEVGFRMSGSLFAVIAPSEHASSHDALTTRIAACGAASDLAAGHALFPSDHTRLSALIRHAMGTIRPPSANSTQIQEFSSELGAA